MMNQCTMPGGMQPKLSAHLFSIPDTKDRHNARSDDSSQKVHVDSRRRLRGTIRRQAVGDFPLHRFAAADTPCLVDVFVYSLDVEGLDHPVLAAVTNGMSDLPMYLPEDPETPIRRELIQYFRECTEVFARRLHDCAWLPHFDNFALESEDTIPWPDKLVGDLQASLFLPTVHQMHAEFSVEIDSDETSLLWHIPITAEELEYKNSRGIDALIDRMDKVGLPWLFDPNNRPSLLPQKKRK
jgi:hypothetical protein